MFLSTEGGEYFSTLATTIWLRGKRETACRTDGLFFKVWPETRGVEKVEMRTLNYLHPRKRQGGIGAMSDNVRQWISTGTLKTGQGKHIFTRKLGHTCSSHWMFLPERGILDVGQPQGPKLCAAPQQRFRDRVGGNRRVRGEELEP